MATVPVHWYEPNNDQAKIDAQTFIAGRENEAKMWDRAMQATMAQNQLDKQEEIARRQEEIERLKISSTNENVDRDYANRLALLKEEQTFKSNDPETMFAKEKLGIFSGLGDEDKRNMILGIKSGPEEQLAQAKIAALASITDPKQKAALMFGYDPDKERKMQMLEEEAAARKAQQAVENARNARLDTEKGVEQQYILANKDDEAREKNYLANKVKNQSRLTGVLKKDLEVFAPIAAGGGLQGAIDYADTLVEGLSKPGFGGLSKEEVIPQLDKAAELFKIQISEVLAKMERAQVELAGNPYILSGEMASLRRQLEVIGRGTEGITNAKKAFAEQPPGWWDRFVSGSPTPSPKTDMMNSIGLPATGMIAGGLLGGPIGMGIGGGAGALANWLVYGRGGK